MNKTSKPGRRTKAQRNRAKAAAAKAAGNGVGFSAPSSSSSQINTFVPAFGQTSVERQLRYGAAVLTFLSSTNQVGRYVFTANGLFDPNITGGALSPAGFASLMTFYNHYLVRRARISVIFTNNSTNPTVVGIGMSGDTSGTSDPSNQLELSKEQFTFLNPLGVDGSSKILKMSVDCEKYFGTDTKADPTFRGDAISNPVEQVYFHLWAYAVKGGTAETYIQVIIEYDAMFFEPRDLLPSDSRFKAIQAELREKSSRTEERKSCTDFTVV